jgi:hypothetical protein
MVSAGCEPTSASCASAIYLLDAHFPAMGILTRQEGRTGQVKEIADGF